MSGPPASNASTAVAKSPQPTYASFLSQVDEGRLAADATEELTVLTRELRAIAQIPNTKPKGSITITIKIAAMPGGEMMNVIGDVKIKMPTRPKAQSIFWRTKENGLTVQNPTQREIEFVDVSTGEVAEPPRATLRSL